MTIDGTAGQTRDIGKKIARATAFMLLFKLIARSIGLVSTLILARLLSPTDFGLVAMAVSVVALTELMGAFGFDTALIQRQRVIRAHYDTAWTFNVICGAAIALVLAGLTIPAAEFYGEPRLRSIMPVLAIGALATGLENIGVVNFRKELDFKSEVRFLLSRQIASFAITIPLALIFRSYWALVAGVVAGKIFSAGISYRLHPYRPRFSLQARDDLLHFSKWLFLSNAAGFLQNKSSDFILGRTVGPFGLGLYSVAFEIAVMPSTELIAPVNRAVFPAYSQMSSDLPQLHSKFLDIFGIIALLAFPVAVGLACVASPAVLVVLGPQWVAAIPLLRLFTIAGLAGALQSNLHLMILALGKPKASTLASSGTLLISLPIFVITSLWYGVLGAAWTYVIFALVTLLVVNIVFFRISRVSVKSYLSVLWRPFVSVTVMAAVVVGVDAYAADAVSSNLLRLLALISIGALTYASAVMTLWWASGKPRAAEGIALEFVVQGLARLRSKKALRPNIP